MINKMLPITSPMRSLPMLFLAILLLASAPDSDCAEVWLDGTGAIDVPSPCEAEKSADCPKPIQRLSIGNDFFIFSQDYAFHLGRVLLFTVKSKTFLDLPNSVYLSPNGKFLVAIDAGEGDYDAEVRLIGLENGKAVTLDSLKSGKWSPSYVRFNADRISITGSEFGENPKELFFAYEKKKGKWTLVPTARL